MDKRLEKQAFQLEMFSYLDVLQTKTSLHHNDDDLKDCDNDKHN